MNVFEHVTESQEFFRLRDKSKELIARIEKQLEVLQQDVKRFDTEALKHVNLARGYSESEYMEAIAKWESMRPGRKYIRK